MNNKIKHTPEGFSYVDVLLAECLKWGGAGICDGCGKGPHLRLKLIYVLRDTIFAEESPKDCDAALYYLSKSIDAMSRVDGLVFMPGWQDARGCRIEFQVALEYGKFIKQA